MSTYQTPDDDLAEAEGQRPRPENRRVVPAAHTRDRREGTSTAATARPGA